MSERTIDNALTREELDHLKPSTEELFENTWRATTWYNECVWTAAALFVEAAEESDEFRESFVNERKVEVDAFPEADEEHLVESDEWRQVMKEEVPELHEKLMGIGLSAFQGGSAEQVARRRLREE